jgi:hypothetical protein
MSLSVTQRNVISLMHQGYKLYADVHAMTGFLKHPTTNDVKSVKRPTLDCLIALGIIDAGKFDKETSCLIFSLISDKEVKQ